MEYKSASRRRIFNRTRFFENLQTARSSFHVTTRSISFPICSRLSLGTESVGPATSCRMNRIPPPADVEKLMTQTANPAPAGLPPLGGGQPLGRI